MHDAIEFIKAVNRSTLKRPLTDYPWCLLTSTNIEIGDVYYPFWSRLYFYNIKPCKIRSPIQYNQLELFECLIESSSLLNSLSHGKEPLINFGKINLCVPQALWNVNSPTQKIAIWDYPEQCHRLWTSLTNPCFSVNQIYDKLLSIEQDLAKRSVFAPNNKVYRNPFYAMADWMGLADYHGTDDARKWTLEIIFSLSPGFVRNVTIFNNKCKSTWNLNIIAQI